ncbi:MAG: PepSY domain-containing protein [Phycisphaeraceae bacterium]|nr:PepSY domain-containing protein [Phycisphaeraceae bacterium]
MASMRSFKMFWNIHKWTGIVLALSVVVIAGTGVLLLLKKRFDWIQSPTLRGAAGAPGDFLPLGVIIDRSIAYGDPRIAAPDDIDRIDFRPRQRVHKVRSRDGYLELQVCAITGEILSEAWRTSDFIEQIHDGSIIAEWFKEFVMPIIPAGLVLLAGSGLWLWIEPTVRRRRRRRAAAALTRAGPGPGPPSVDRRLQKR